ncbi:MAG: PDZ domain-containing protein, partial [Pseudomonadales bacterium]|nr:PDZ domain-containing protein [Pseudomonadales bacterium]
MAADGVEYTRKLALGDMRLLENEGDIFRDIGFTHWRPQLKAEIAGVIAEGAAESAGLQPGDLVVSVDGEVVDRWMSLVEMIRAKPNKAMNFIVLRDGAELPLTVIPNSRKVKDGEQGYIGAYQHIPEEVRQQLVTRIEYSMTESIGKAIIKTWDMSTLTLRVLWKMVAGEASLSNISGPITIAT